MNPLDKDEVFELIRGINLAVYGIDICTDDEGDDKYQGLRPADDIFSQEKEE